MAAGGGEVAETMALGGRERGPTVRVRAIPDGRVGAPGERLSQRRGHFFLRARPVLALHADKEFHLIVDNCSTHKRVKVRRWLKRRTRFHWHFTPTSSSWLNMVERHYCPANASTTGRNL